MIPPSQDPFWNAPALAEVWDLSKLKAEDETRLGDALHAVILHFNERLEEGPWLRRVEEAAEPLLALRTRKDIRYTFTILNSDSVNAFSTPGGYIYFSRELFDLIGEDEDYALQFVVGHEIAHVDLQHAIKCLEDPGVKQLSGGTLKLLYFLVVPWGYLEKQDYEADRWVYQRMSALGRTKRESLAFLRKFEGYARTNGFENLRAGPAPGAEGSPLENHFRAHPIPRHRLKELEVLQSKPRQ